MCIYFGCAEDEETAEQAHAKAEVGPGEAAVRETCPQSYQEQSQAGGYILLQVKM